MAHRSLPEGVDGFSVPYPGRPVILLDEGLCQRERNAVLAHELIHLERQWPCGASWAEEERVCDEVARRLVPLDQLHCWVVTRELDEAQVHAWHVAEEWWVPEDVALRALKLLLDSIWSDINDYPSTVMVEQFANCRHREEDPACGG